MATIQGTSSGDTINAASSPAVTNDADSILGLGGADSIAGLGGADTIEGGRGNDTLDGGESNDLLRGDADDDLILGNFGADTLEGGEGNDTLSGGTLLDLLRGGTGFDSLSGDAADDTLEGGKAGDTLSGGDGNDWASYALSDEGVRASLGVMAGVTGDAQGDVYLSIENLRGSELADTLGGDSAANVVEGLAGADLIVASRGADTLDGGAGADTLFASEDGARLIGGADDDALSGAGGRDLMEGGGGNDCMGGGGANDTLLGGDGTDTLIGGAGLDLIQGGGDGDVIFSAGAQEQPGGWDTLDGGAGADTLALLLTTDSFLLGGVGYALAGVALDLTDGLIRLVGVNGADELGFDTIGQVASAGSGTLSSIEAIVGSAGADTLTGDAGNNRLNGNAGDDLVRGGAGADSLESTSGSADTLEGGAGADDFYIALNSLTVISYAGAREGVWLDLGTGFTSGEDAAGDRFFGDGIASLVGSDHNDTLAAQIGQPMVVRGGEGNDLLSVTFVGTMMDGEEGDDEVVLRIDDMLDSGAITAIGGSGRDVFSMTLEAINGYDPIGGVVSLRTRFAADVKWISGGLVTESRAELFDFEDLRGSALADTLEGDAQGNRLDGGAGADSISAGAGNDTLVGGAGADTLLGGEGRDAASHAGALAGVKVSLAAGAANSGDAAGDVHLGIEDLIGSDLADTLSGDAGANSIIGLAGSDVIIGGNGDRLDGGQGGDRYILDGTAILVLDSGTDAGRDTIVSDDSVALLGSRIEDVELTGEPSALTATGNALGNRLTGNGFDNVLIGLDGADTLDGGLGQDTLIGGAGRDVFIVNSVGDVLLDDATTPGDVRASVSWKLGANFANLTLVGGNLNGTGNARANQIIGTDGANSLAGLEGADVVDGRRGADTLDGGTGADRLFGGQGADRLVGDLGADTLTGGLGADTLDGGAGNDRFVYGAATDSPASASDLIIGFVRGQDRIDLSAIDANGSGAGNGTFVFRDALAFTGAGQVRFQVVGSTTEVLGNLDANIATAELRIVLQGVFTLAGADFVL